jgi:hypothetical protein
MGRKYFLQHAQEKVLKENQQGKQKPIKGILKSERKPLQGTQMIILSLNIRVLGGPSKRLALVC